jgi:hypothetical protein
MLSVRSHDHHAAVWAHHAEYERRLHSLLDALPKDFADDFGQFIHFPVVPKFGPQSRLRDRDRSCTQCSLAILAIVPSRALMLYAACSYTFVSACLQRAQ